MDKMQRLSSLIGKAFHVMTPAEVAAHDEEQKRRNRDAAQRALKAGRCPARLIAALSDLKETRPLGAARALIASPRDERWFLVLLGGVGTGKSTAAAWAARQLLFRQSLAEQPSGTHREFCRWLTGAELGRLYTHDRDEARDWEATKRASVLVLDDLGTEGADARLGEALWELVEARTANVWPTIITSNLGAAAFKKRYGDRIADRVRSCAIILEGNAQSLRGDK